jgi:transglutaminase-like putative cysteine protease
MDRRTFLTATAAFGGLSAAAALLPKTISATAAAPMATVSPDSRWRRFKIELEAAPAVASGPLKLWLPLPSQTPYQRVHSIRWTPGGATDSGEFYDDTYRAPMVYANWPDGSSIAPSRVVYEVETRDYVADLKAAAKQHKARPDASVELYLKPTKHMPIDGIVKESAAKMVAGKHTPVEQGRAIYDWIVDNTFRDPKVKGCGIGDIRFMLESGNLGGKCADLNALFVGLARAVGLPAREVYGIRAAKSRQFKSLGAAGDISKAQHCRAEFHVAGAGWIPVDPADVRKAVLEEKLPLDHPDIVALRERLFGFWEMNWIAYNSARDFTLPNGPKEPFNYLMYPEANHKDEWLDGIDPSVFKYKITSAEA